MSFIGQDIGYKMIELELQDAVNKGQPQEPIFARKRKLDKYFKMLYILLLGFPLVVVPLITILTIKPQLLTFILLSSTDYAIASFVIILIFAFIFVTLNVWALSQGIGKYITHTGRVPGHSLQANREDYELQDRAERSMWGQTWSEKYWYYYVIWLVLYIIGLLFVAMTYLT